MELTLYDTIRFIPRSRGEHVGCKLRVERIDGLSPLARGTLRLQRRDVVLARGTPVLGAAQLNESRFIPARAGNTQIRTRYFCDLSVYPRSRGEHLPDGTKFGGQTGLSPLARGTRLSGIRFESFHRFIPARAGNTKPILMLAGKNTVYPRSRGEHTTIELVAARGSGLSPLARGTPHGGQGSTHVVRFIPARAGNTH